MDVGNALDDIKIIAGSCGQKCFAQYEEYTLRKKHKYSLQEILHPSVSHNNYFPTSGNNNIYIPCFFGHNSLTVFDSHSKQDFGSLQQ